MGLQCQVIGQFVRQYFQKSLVVRAHHLNVQVIIPGDETAMPNGTYQCSTAEPIPNVVALAYLVNLNKDVQHAHLLASQQRAVRIEALAQFLVWYEWCVHDCCFILTIDASPIHKHCRYEEPLHRVDAPIGG